MRMSLLELRVGETAVVDIIETESTLKQRLYDIGLTKGSVVKVLHESPSKSPRAYLIRGCVIALRNCDAEKIIVTDWGEGCDRIC
ncbi:MAG: ferrous iron transport protein A [Clostridia bacterium]|nr:ferrous iron transport protein A [Clostridia bacterium]